MTLAAKLTHKSANVRVSAKLSLNTLRDLNKSRMVAHTFSVDLPMPPSLNNLFATFNNRRIPSREYKAWKLEAAQMLLAQRARCAVGPVAITITLQQCRGDLDNRIKACLDCLVENGIIDGDSSKTVRKITAQWGDVVGAHVEVSPILLTAPVARPSKQDKAA